MYLYLNRPFTTVEYWQEHFWTMVPFDAEALCATKWAKYLPKIHCQSDTTTLPPSQLERQIFPFLSSRTATTIWVCEKIEICFLSFWVNRNARHRYEKLIERNKENFFEENELKEGEKFLLKEFSSFFKINC